MAITHDNLFEQQSAGQADWDSGLGANFTLLERGLHVKSRAGHAVNTGDVVWMSSGDFFYKFDPNSESIMPHAYSPFAASSGDTLQAVRLGTVRSLAVHSAIVPGKPVYVSALTPGFVVGSYSGADRCIGIGLPGGLMFQPRPDVPERLVSSLAISAVVGSTHVFTMDAGRWGWNRYANMVGNSADLVELKFFKDTARTIRLYETRSGGVSVVGSFFDGAGWPYENTNSAPISGIIYGSVKIMSGAAVGSDTISVRAQWDRTV